MRKLISLLGTGCLLAVSPCGAITFTAGSSPYVTADYSITASAALETKSHASGLVGLGVAGATGGEIDVNEWLRVDLTVPQMITEFSLAFFYNGPEHNDLNEVAQITVNGTDVYTATVTGDATIAWTGLGSVTVLSPATDTGDGWFRFNSPFGSTLVDTLEFTAVWVNNPLNNSDYSLATFSTPGVPDGGATLGLLGVALLGLHLLGRRSK